MLRVLSIDHIEPFSITCSLNNGIQRQVDVKPLIQDHLHLPGVSVLLEIPEFLKAEIGEMGEVRWRNVVRNSAGDRWDYDISPEFIFHHGKTVGA